MLKERVAVCGAYSGYVSWMAALRAASSIREKSPRSRHPMEITPCWRSNSQTRSHMSGNSELGAATSTWIAHFPRLATSRQLLNYLSTWNTWSHTSSPCMRVFVLWKPKPGLKDFTHGPSRAHITKPSSGSSSSRRISAYMHLVKQ